MYMEPAETKVQSSESSFCYIDVPQFSSLTTKKGNDVS